MAWEKNRNLNSLSPHGLKESSGFAAPALHDPNCVVCREMGPGLLNSMVPLGAGRSSPYMPEPTAAGEKARR
jgi:hypothetical protein